MEREQTPSIFLLDGFPRNQANIDSWKRVMGDVELGTYLFFECSFDVMRDRISLYIKLIPIVNIRLFAVERGKTSGRADDNPETIQKRFDTFTNETQPLV